jgi:hypothetical protein
MPSPAQEHRFQIEEQERDGQNDDGRWTLPLKGALSGYDERRSSR